MATAAAVEVEMVGSDWPAVRDAMRTLDVSDTYVARLIRQGRIRAVHTRLGYLIDPESLAAFAAERTTRARLMKRGA
jgi:excisionase family DNA binding protein